MKVKQVIIRSEVIVHAEQVSLIDLETKVVFTILLFSREF